MTGTDLLINGVVYSESEVDGLRGLPSAEALVIHQIKAEFAAEPLEEPRSGSSSELGHSSSSTKCPTYTIVCTQRPTDTLLDAIEDFQEGTTRLPFPVAWVMGDTSLGERRAAQWCQDREIPVTIVAKAAKGDWDEGAHIRDERVVALSQAVFAFDTSARSIAYRKLAERMRVPYTQI